MHPGCLILTRDTRCPKHTKQHEQAVAAVDNRRGSASSRGYTSKWRRYALSFLKGHPLCRECEKVGRTTLATVVDHIRPHRGDMKLFWLKSNHQPLCKRCHDIKTTTEDGGFGNRPKEVPQVGPPSIVNGVMVDGR